LAYQPHSNAASRVYTDFSQRQRNDSSLIAAELGDNCGTYKVERPSPPTTPNTEPQQTDAIETWNSGGAHYVASNSEEDIAASQTGGGKDEGETEEVDLVTPDDHEIDASDDVTSDSTSTTTATTAAQSHHPQQQHQQHSVNSSSDVRPTHSDVYPIYPWMTRVHSTHGKSTGFLVD